MSDDELREPPLEATWPWRTGRSVGRTIYACPPKSSHRNGEVLIGMMDSPELAAAAVEAHNRLLSERKWNNPAAPAQDLGG